jgi:uncharacterized membrane protein SpoIIM required for sporulation
MVLESLFNPFVVKKKPWEMFFAGCVYSFVGLFLSYLVFRELSGILMVFLIVMAAIPIVYNTIRKEEELDLEIKSEIGILKEHYKVLMFLLYFFTGTVVALTLSYIFLPTSMVEPIFKFQSQAIVSVSNHVSGNITQFGLFKGIFFNNLRVLFFCLVFSFLYGMGAIFILTWNASVVAAAMGNLVKTKLAALGSTVGFSVIGNYFSIGAFSFMRYMSHGIVEIAAYFIAGIAGGIISIAVIKHNLENEKVLYDSLDLIFISIAVLFVAAIIEVYVTPVLFIH